MQAEYRRKMCRLEEEVDELRQLGTADDESQNAPTISRSHTAQLRLYISRLERHEDGHMRDQLKLVKEFGRRLERVEDIGCSYFKPRSTRCHLQNELFRRLDKGQLDGIVKRHHLCEV